MLAPLLFLRLCKYVVLFTFAKILLCIISARIYVTLSFLFQCLCVIAWLFGNNELIPSVQSSFEKSILLKVQILLSIQ